MSRKWMSLSLNSSTVNCKLGWKELNLVRLSELVVRQMVP